MSPRLEQLYTVMDQYGSCLEEETTRLRENRFADIRDLYTQKVHLNEQYTILVRQMVDSQELKTFDIQDKENIRRRTIRLQEQLEENDLLIRSAEQSYDTIMNILLESIRANQTASCIYTPKGHVANSQTPQAVAVNQEL